MTKERLKQMNPDSLVFLAVVRKNLEILVLLSMTLLRMMFLVLLELKESLIRLILVEERYTSIKLIK